jgi:hypothetical protein
VHGSFLIRSAKSEKALSPFWLPELCSPRLFELTNPFAVTGHLRDLFEGA